jgi:hypothetical protein
MGFFALLSAWEGIGEGVPTNPARGVTKIDDRLPSLLSSSLRIFYRREFSTEIPAKLKFIFQISHLFTLRAVPYGSGLLKMTVRQPGGPSRYSLRSLSTGPKLHPKHSG